MNVKLPLLDASINPVSFPDWLALIDDTLNTGQRRVLLGNHNLHSLYLLQHDITMKQFYLRCQHCYIDGMPVRWMLALAGHPTDHEQRFTLMDKFSELLQVAEKKQWSVFYLGSKPEVVALADDRIKREYPELRFHLHTGYLGAKVSDDEHLLDTINVLSPDILMVGMGMPRQEAWLLKYLDQLDIGVATQTGATLDYFTGMQAKPPLWMSNLGLAWLYRLAHDPVRLWRRYMWEPWTLLWPTLMMWWNR